MRAEQIGFVFQAFNLVPTLTAIENVALPAKYAGRRRSETKAAAADALRMVGLSDRENHRPMELSGGQQQRVAVARALVNEPALLLADEPTGNLDSESTDEMLGLLLRFNAERGQTTGGGDARRARGRGLRPHPDDARRRDLRRSADFERGCLTPISCRQIAHRGLRSRRETFAQPSLL